MRQAVVIIHGIGEQKPMTTLRGFVKSMLAVEKDILNIPADSEPSYWVMPDTVSENYELRKITAKSNKSRPTTDFYEYYWANNMRDTTFGHVLPWLKTLLFVNPTKVPSRLLSVWLFSWSLILLGFYFAISGGVQKFQSIEATSTFIYAALSFIISMIIQLVFIQYIGDAARYLTANPENIGERHNIRKNGIDLIRKIHESKRDYKRIILVGHSLGSVIGYDIITHLWNEYRKEISIPKEVDSNHFEEGKMLQPKLHEIQNMDVHKDHQQFRQLQRDVLKEQQAFNNKWLISDFITLGSPLAHAKLLMAKSEADLKSRIRDREFPICPPIKDKNGLFSYQNYFNTTDRGIWYLHHAAPFACTKWSNLYYQGDVVGGPLASVFGLGITDKKLNFSRSKWLSRIATSHTKYWLDDSSDDLNISNTKEYAAIKEIYNQLDLALV